MSGGKYGAGWGCAGDYIAREEALETVYIDLASP